MSQQFGRPQECWLCAVDDHLPIAYQRGDDFVRRNDAVVWAHLRDGLLIAPDTGTAFAYRVGSFFYDVGGIEPRYYVTSASSRPSARTKERR